MSQPFGLYIHVPFCVSKCPYCDFYSLPAQDEARMDAYTTAVVRSLEQWHSRLDNPVADTLYVGGGTPSLLGGARLSRILDTASRLYGLADAEITMEANPADHLGEVFRAFAAAGGNRISLGMQTSEAVELTHLGRRHCPQDVDSAVGAAHAAGIHNISLDMMLGIEGQTAASVVAAAQTAARLGARHVSAYMLKVEEGTPFYARQDTMALPDEDTTAELYLTACNTLDLLGYHQYEISNFSMPHSESRHNLKYWNGDTYLGIGPSAHSFMGGKRFYYPRDLAAFLAGNEPLDERSEDENAEPDAIFDAGEKEYLMLRLRLTEGVTEQGFFSRFGYPLPTIYYERAARLPSPLVIADTEGIRLTREGFLLSNTLIGRILD